MAGILMFLLSPFPDTQAADPVFRAAHLNPMDHPFWTDMADFMKAAAEDLNVELDVYPSASNNRFKLYQEANGILNGDRKPDWLIYWYLVDVGKRILQSAQDAGVNAIIVNTDVPEKDRDIVGRPREKLSHWIGHVVPDDKKVGHELAELLFEHARAAGKQASDGKIHVIGLSGSRDSTAAIYRNQGLEEAAAAHEDVLLHQIFWMNWDPNIAEKMVAEIFQRHPETSVIWGVYDGAALGAIRGLEKIGKIPGKDVFVGGIDWSAEGLKAIQQGKMVASFGGHFMDGAWSLVLAYDYHNGHDFKDRLGTVVKTSLQKIDKKNVKRHLSLFAKKNWQFVDFKKFTFTHYPKRKRYDFSLKSFLRHQR